MENTATNTTPETAEAAAPARRGRGRPTSKRALQLQARFREDNRVAIRYGDAPLPSEATARMRLYAVGKALGIPLRVRKTGTGAVTRLEATPRVEDAAEDAAEANAEA